MNVTASDQVFLTHLGTAVPSHQIAQSEAADFMCAYLDLDASKARILRSIYRATTINQRYSVLSDYGKTSGWSFYPNGSGERVFPDTTKRMQIYREEALPLAQKAIADASIESFDGVTHLITVSCTGMFAPGLDIQLVESLGLRSQVERTAIQFMGCYAAFNALKVARSIVKGDQSAQVLIVSVELCSLHFQRNWNTDNLIVNALFSDGAAAALIQAKPAGKTALSLDDFYCDLAFEGADDMTWNLGQTGFEMTLTQDVPQILLSKIGPMMERYTGSASAHADPDLLWAVHPGGTRILEAIERGLNISEDANQAARSVLQEYGNMSSATVLFVLKALMEKTPKSTTPQPLISLAFGPGLTLESARMHLHHV